MNISKRALDMSASPIRRLMQYANMAKKQGKTVYHLNIGQPDIATPEQFYEAIHEQHDKVLAYAPSEGDEVLIKSIVNYYNKLGYGIEKKFNWQGGATCLFNFTTTACLDRNVKVSRGHLYLFSTYF